MSVRSLANGTSHYLWIASFCGLALFTPFSISGANISIGLGFIAMAIAAVADPSARARYRAIPRDPLFLAGLLLAASAVPAVFMSEDFARARRDWGSYWILLTYFLVAYNLTSDALRRKVFWILFGSLGLSCVVALIGYAGGVDFGLFRIGPENRASSTLFTMTFAGILYQLITVNFSVALGDRTMGRRVILLGAGLVLQSVSLLLTLTRGAWLALLGGLSTAVVLLRRRVVFAAAAVLVVVGAAIVAGNETLRERVTGALRTARAPGNLESPADVNVSTRFVLWDVSWELIKRHPLLGVGMGDFTIEARKLIGERHVETAVDSHNIYLQILVTRGAVGFAAFVFFWVVLLKSLLGWKRRLADGDPFAHYFVTGVIGATVAVLVGALTENNIDDDEVFTTFMFLVGMAKSFDLFPVASRPRSSPER